INEAKHNIAAREKPQQGTAPRRQQPNRQTEPLHHSAPAQLAPNAPLSQQEWTELLLHPPTNQLQTPAAPDKYSPAPATVEQLLSREAILLRDPCRTLPAPQL